MFASLQTHNLILSWKDRDAAMTLSVQSRTEDPGRGGTAVPGSAPGLGEEMPRSADDVHSDSHMTK